MSRSWANGSTPAWRRLRLVILTRDRWVCQLCNQPIDPRLKPPHPMSSVHHTVGRTVSGDDPRYLVAAHRDRNLKAGEPGKRDPHPQSARAKISPRMVRRKSARPVDPTATNGFRCRTKQVLGVPPQVIRPCVEVQVQRVGGPAASAARFNQRATSSSRSSREWISK